MGFPGGQLVKNPPAVWETWVPSLGWEDSPGGGKGYPLQCSGLENSMDFTAHGVAKGRKRLSDFHSTPLHFFIHGILLNHYVCVYIYI